MADDIVTREEKAAVRAIGHGFVILKITGREDFPYIIQSESALPIEQVEEILDAWEGASS